MNTSSTSIDMVLIDHNSDCLDEVQSAVEQVPGMRLRWYRSQAATLRAFRFGPLGLYPIALCLSAYNLENGENGANVLRAVAVQFQVEGATPLYALICNDEQQKVAAEEIGDFPFTVVRRAELRDQLLALLKQQRA